MLQGLRQLIEENCFAVQHHLDNSVLQGTLSSYVERDQISKILEEKLYVLHQVSSLPYSLAIYGLEGSGKFQLVLRYIEKNRRRYSHVFWVNAANKQSAFESLRSIGQYLKISNIGEVNSEPEAPLADSRLVCKVLKWFQRSSGREAEWLVVIDNADDLS